LLAPLGRFLDYDYFQYSGCLEDASRRNADAGFERVECVWRDGAAAIVKTA
jgi:hypothetical protein